MTTTQEEWDLIVAMQRAARAEGRDARLAVSRSMYRWLLLVAGQPPKDHAGTEFLMGVPVVVDPEMPEWRVEGAGAWPLVSPVAAAPDTSWVREQEVRRDYSRDDGRPWLPGWLTRWWHRVFPRRWTEAEILWLRLKSHQQWLRTEQFSDPQPEEFRAHRWSRCWECQAWESVHLRTGAGL